MVKSNNRSNQQKKQLCTCSTLFLYISLPLFCTTTTCETSRNFLVTRFMEEMLYVFSFTFFFTAAYFHLALVAASISHFVTAATQFSCCSSNKKMSPLFFISRSRPLSPFFSLSFAGLPPTFSFSPSFSCSIFQICGHDNQSKLNTLDNTDTEKNSAFRFRLY